MKASVIIPVYNAEAYLNETLSTIANQTESDFEVLLIDDCSEDNSSEICKAICETDKRFKYYRMPKNSGPAATRNVGIERAQGDYLLFVDADDQLEKEYVERLVREAQRTEADIVWCNFHYQYSETKSVIFTNHQKRGGITPDEYIKSFISNIIGIGCLWNKIYRRQFIIENNLCLNEKRVYGEDWDFNLRVALLSPSVYVINDSLYNYLQRPRQSVSTRYYPSDFDSYCETHRMLGEIINKLGSLDDQNEIEQRFVYNIVSLLYKLQHSRLLSNEKKTEFKRITSAPLFRELFKKDITSNPKLTKRQKVTAFLLKYRMNMLAKTILSL